jgi:ribonucleotide reductase, class II
MQASDPEVASSGSPMNGADPATAAQLDLGFAQRTAGTQEPGLDLDLSDEVVMPTSITKRDGRVVAFDPNRIERAIGRCFAALGRQPYTPIPELALRVVNIMSARRGQPTVEQVQDAVELTLQAAGEFEAAKAYILYRAEHAKQRQERPIPDEVRAAFAEADHYFPTPLQKFQFFDKYSRFDYDNGRRETWIETVDRSVAYLHELVAQHTGADLGSEYYERIRRFILEMKSMPSMRLLAMAGPPARRDNTCIYNCSYQPVESVDSFAEALLISMAGCGVGFSVERKYVESFPRVQRQRGLDPLRHVIEDSAQGWAEALRQGLHAWFEGRDVQFDYSHIREAGTPLRTKGGRASGPGPLRTMLEFARGRILARQGMHLRPLDAHDIMCMVGNAAVSGGVRRCLPAGTRVHTSRGAIPIEEVRRGDLVMTADGYKPVTGWVDQGVQDVVEIVTESGTIFRCTPHHRVAVLTDVWGGHTFKYARDLTTDDRLLFISRPIDGEPQPLAPLLPKRAADHSGSEVRQPVLDLETAWFLGKFFADGYAQVGIHDAAGKRGNTQVTVACNLQETEQIDRVTAWMERHGLVVQRLLGRGRRLTLRSSNRQMARWMQNYKRPNTLLVVPEPIWRAPALIRAAFLAGLMDGDGCFTDRPVTVVATVYEAFAREVVKLLATLGVVAEVRQRRPPTEQGWQAQWIVAIKDALALRQAEHTIGAQACTTWVARHPKQAGYTVPGWMVRRDVAQQRWADVWPAGRDPNTNSATLSTTVGARHYVPVAVREVQPGGSAHTYDIEVRDGSLFVAEGYLVHNTAMISLFDYDDLEMRLCKSGDFEHDNSQRWNANNSAVWPERGLDQIEVVEQVLDMVKSQRGEPGIFNRKAAFDLSPARRQRLGYTDFGTNPCITGETWVLTTRGPQRVRDLVGRLHGTFVNGRAYATTEDGFWRTGTQPVLRLRTREGYELRLTPNHHVLVVSHQSPKVQPTEWREAGSLKPGERVVLHCHRGAEWVGDGTYDEGWLLGSLVGDGPFSSKLGQQGQVLTMAHLDYWGSTRQVLSAGALQRLQAAVATRSDRLGSQAERWGKARVSSAGLAELAHTYGIRQGAKHVSEQVEQTSSAFHRGFLRGLFDADGSVQGNQAKATSVRLSQSNLDNLLATQRMLLRLGIVSTISRARRPGSSGLLPDGRGGSASSWCHPDHELVISADNVRQFASAVGFSDPNKAARLAASLAAYRRHLHRERFTATVERIEPDGEEDVYDCSVPDVHAFDANGLFAHNCGEINLRKYQFCNLSIAVARAEDTLESLKEKVDVATIIGTIQSLATHFPDLRPMWKQHCEEERLLGVDINGQLDSPAAQDPTVMRTLREHVVETNRVLAARLGINQSAATTCVKPSGNSSQLLNCSSGLHARWAPYYERNVRVAATSPIFKVLRDAGVPMDPENGQTRDDANTWVIHFPVRSPGGAITRKDRSAIEQCEYWLRNKLNWTEHNPSVTILYRQDEIIDLTRWIWEHRDFIGGMAFLPTFDAHYAQLPYIEISQEEYEKRIASFPDIDFSKIFRYESTDLTNAAQELACLAGQCELD